MNAINDVIILAGGKGERLSHTVTDTQKTMAPVGGEPFLRYLADALIKNGVNRIVFAVAYKWEQIYSYFGNSYKSAEILYSKESSPLGTGGAIKNALKLCTSKNVTVLNGDTYFDVDYNLLESFHCNNNADITISVKKLYDFSRYGTLGFEKNGKVSAFYEKKQVNKGYINGGIYVLNKDLAENMPNGAFSFEKDVLEKLRFTTFALPFDGYFIDIGIPEDYFRAQTEIPLLFKKNQFKAAFLDRDGVICKEKHHLYKTEDFEFTYKAPEAIEQLRELGYLIIVITNQAGVAKGLYTEDDVNNLHSHMLNCLCGKAYIDAVYYCPFHPEALLPEYKRQSSNRKPQPGMIKRAVADFSNRGININLASSVIIGDTEKDILTGINAGIGKKILVRSGHKIANENTTQADIVTDSLYTASELLKSK